MAKNENSEDTTFGLLAHILGIFTGFVGPLVMYIVSKEKGGNALENSKHALNFQLSLIIYYIGATIILFGLFGILYLAIYVISLVFMIKASIVAANGEVYKYPLSISFLK